MTADRDQARREAAELLGCNDIEHLSAADGLRVDMISALRLVIDSEQASILSGGSADVGKLNVAVQSLIALLPNRELPAAEANEPDPRQLMWEIYSGMRKRGADVGQGYDGLKLTVERLQAENAQLQLKAKLAGSPDVPAESEPAPAAAMWCRFALRRLSSQQTGIRLRAVCGGRRSRLARLQHRSSPHRSRRSTTITATTAGRDL